MLCGGMLCGGMLCGGMLCDGMRVRVDKTHFRRADSLAERAGSARRDIVTRANAIRTCEMERIHAAPWGAARQIGTGMCEKG